MKNTLILPVTLTRRDMEDDAEGDIQHNDCRYCHNCGGLSSSSGLVYYDWKTYCITISTCSPCFWKISNGQDFLEWRRQVATDILHQMGAKEIKPQYFT